MKKIIMFLIMALFLIGCVDGSDQGPVTPEKMKTVCLDGVTYYYFKQVETAHLGFGYMSVKFNKDGTVNTCEEYKNREMNRR